MNQLPRRFAWFLVAASVLVSAALVWLRFQPSTRGQTGLAEAAALGMAILGAACLLNLGFAVVVQVRAKQLDVRTLSLTGIAALLPFFMLYFCEAAGIGRG